MYVLGICMYVHTHTGLPTCVKSLHIYPRARERAFKLYLYVRICCTSARVNLRIGFYCVQINLAFG